MTLIIEPLAVAALLLSGGSASDVPTPEADALPPSVTTQGQTIVGLEATEDLTITIGGYIKLDAIHDFDAIGTEDQFKTSTIPVPGESSNGNTRFHARDTRLHLGLSKPTSLGVIHGYVEGNFFGDGTDFTLRHAYAKTDNLLAGQTWTNFMMIESRPETLDFEGPDGSVFLRQGQVRWTQPFHEESPWHWSVGLEDPGSDVVAPMGSTAEEVYPDLTAGLRRDYDEHSHLFVSGILREISYDGMASDSVVGWGANVSGRHDTHGRDNFRYQIAYGEGIARYIEDLRGFGLDAAPDANGNLEALPTFGGFLAYQHFWSESLRSTAGYSATGVDNSAGQAGDALKRTSYASANLIWSADKAFDVGVEVLHGTRKNKDGQDADATRVQFSFIYRL